LTTFDFSLKETSLGTSVFQEGERGCNVASLSLNASSSLSSPGFCSNS